MWYLQEKKDTVENWAYVSNVLSKEQCDQVIKIGESLIPNTAFVGDGHLSDVRDSKVSWITPNKDSEWLFRHMTDVVLYLNSNFFNFDLDGFLEGFQFTKYEAPAGKYDLHIDKTFNKSIRKLSIVVQLSTPTEYEGGELCIQTSDEAQLMKKEQGYLVAFPSYTLHGVRPVTSGTRYSLVAWLTGPRFK